MVNKLKNLPEDVKIFDQLIFSDNRGYLKCIYEDQNDINLTGFSSKISYSSPNVARGMHWQKPLAPQIKAITILEGSIIDFLINLDPNSPNFGNFYSFELSSNDNKTIIIPKQYGHGFLSIGHVKFFYNCFGKYSPQDEISINIIDLITKYTDLNVKDLNVSKKDHEAKCFYEWETMLRK